MRLGSGRVAVRRLGRYCRTPDSPTMRFRYRSIGKSPLDLRVQVSTYSGSPETSETEGGMDMTTEPVATPATPHRVVIVGAGFGGLEATLRTDGRAGQHHAARPPQPSSVPAAVVSGRDRVARDLGDRLADPLSVARSPGGHDLVRHGDRRRCGRKTRAARGRRRVALRHARSRHRRASRLFRP